MGRWQAFREGVGDIAPALLGIVPFGMITGAAALDAGLPASHAIGMSLVIFAGTAQLAAIELLETHAPAVVVVGTVLIINLRLLMYSASLAPYLEDFSTRWKAILPYFLTDHVYALFVTRFDDPSGGSDAPTRSQKRWYYLGVAIALWGAWQASTVAGVLLGARLPPRLGLEFIVPLTFLALLVPAVETRATGSAAVVAGSLAVITSGLPLNLNLVVAAIGGISTGVWVDRRGR